NSKRGSIPKLDKLRLSKSQGASTPAELKRMQNVPYASAVGSIMVSCYTDAGYLTDANDLKSQTGYVFVLNGGAVDWKSAKQSIFATSSVEAEYIATYDASKEAVWVRKFIYGLGVVPIIKKPIRMYCDNTRAITIANESGITKEKVHTDDNLADPFTKVLAFPKHSEHTRNIGMLPASSLMGDWYTKMTTKLICQIYDAGKQIWSTKGDELEIATKDFIDWLKVLEGQLGDKPYMIGDSFGLRICRYRAHTLRLLVLYVGVPWEDE
ncbi:retrotransposon protein, putative, ty1-copia subclass, partial [Tanacetum coccineum]